MIDRPFYSSIKIIIVAPLLVFSANIVLIIILGMESYDGNKIDKLFHVLGGASVSISAAGILWNLKDLDIIELQDMLVLRCLVFGFLCFSVISWEILEYVLLPPIFSEYLTYTDTVTDMIFGLTGGLAAMFFIRRPAC